MTDARLVPLMLAGLLVASTARAQTSTAFWTPPAEIVTVAEAQAATYTLYINNGAGIPLVTVTCALAASVITCQAPITAMPVGTRYELSAKTAATSEGPRSVPFIKGYSTAPTNFRTQ